MISVICCLSVPEKIYFKVFFTLFHGSLKRIGYKKVFIS